MVVSGRLWYCPQSAGGSGDIHCRTVRHLFEAGEIVVHVRLTRRPLRVPINSPTFGWTRALQRWQRPLAVGLSIVFLACGAVLALTIWTGAARRGELGLDG